MPKRKKTIGSEVIGEAKTVLDQTQPLDAFVCVYEPNIDRQLQVLEVWKQLEAQGQVRLFVLIPATRGVTEHQAEWAERYEIKPEALVPIQFLNKEFQRGRRITAEAIAQTSVYIVADDDCEPVMPKSMMVVARHLMLKSPTYVMFGILTPMPANATINPWTPSADEYPLSLPVVNDDNVMEHVNVGGIRFTRRGVLPAHPGQWKAQDENRVDEADPMRGWKYDQAHAEQMRERQYRVGYMKHAWMRHLGETNPKEEEYDGDTRAYGGLIE